MKTNFYEFILVNLADSKGKNIFTVDENTIRLVNSIFKNIIYVNGKLQSIDSDVVYEICALAPGNNSIAISYGNSLVVNITISYEKNWITVMKQINKDLLYQNFELSISTNGISSLKTLVYTDVVDILDKYEIKYVKEELEKIGITSDICYELKVPNDSVYDVLCTLINESCKQLSHLGYSFDINSLYSDIIKKDEKIMVKKQNQLQIVHTEI